MMWLAHAGARLMFAGLVVCSVAFGFWMGGIDPTVGDIVRAGLIVISAGFLHMVIGAMLHSAAGKT
jgi:hypothetical protein